MGCCHCAKEKTRRLATAEARRRHLASNPLIIEREQNFPDHIEKIREYVDTGKGHLISTTCFRPKSKEVSLKGMICFVIGYTSHTDWTDTDTAIKFVNRGYIFVTYDHFGHGRSDGIWIGNRTDSYSTYVDDAVYIFERAKRKFTPPKYADEHNKFHYYLLGHSLGGAISIEVSKRYTSSQYYHNVESIAEADDDDNVDEKSPLKHNDAIQDALDKYRNDYVPRALVESMYNFDIKLNTNDVAQDALYGWDGLILSAPMVKIKESMQPPQFVVQILRQLVPLFPNARVVPTSSLQDKLTRDEHYHQFVQKNPLGYDDKPALQTAYVLLTFAQHIEEELDKVKLPVLIMHGEKDEITDPAFSQLLYDKCSSEIKQIKIFEGGWHALLIDTCCDQVMDVVDRWIEDRNNKKEK